MKRRTVHAIAALCVVALVTGGSAAAKAKKASPPASKNKPVVQTTAPAQRPQGPASTDRPRSAEQRLREALGATEEQWKSFGPQVMKAHALVQQLEDRGMPDVKNERARHAVTTAQQTPLSQATVALQKLLADPAASPSAIKTEMAAVRVERENVHKDLQAVRAELQSLLTERQQAQALLLGLLE